MDEQLRLFDAPPAHQLTCAFGRPWVNPDWPGPHHCDACAANVEEACRRFDEMVQAGKYNRLGYTRAEWKAAGYRPSGWADCDRTQREPPGGSGDERPSSGRKRSNARQNVLGVREGSATAQEGDPA